MHPWGIGEILLVFAIILVFWGPSRLGNVGKGMGEGIRNFKDSLRGHDPKPDERRTMPPPPPNPPPPPPNPQ